MSFGKLAHRLLLALPAETAHNLGKSAMELELQAPGPYTSPQLVYLFDQLMDNPIGLAAGFDKNGELVNAARQYGFGFLEVGSVTHRGGPGNPKPRMFRLPGTTAIMNRMGLNGDPACIVADRLSRATWQKFGVNIAKTHDPMIMGDDAVRDIVHSYELLKDFGLYTAINISCPNTREGKTFEEPGALRELLAALRQVRPTSSRPLLLKLSPLLQSSQLEELMDIARFFRVEGFICCNTMPYTDPKLGSGGRSGATVFCESIRIIQQLRQRHWTGTILGVGGIFSGSDAEVYFRAGANAVQVYNGFVRGPFAGPDFAHVVNDYVGSRVRFGGVNEVSQPV